MRKIIFKLVGIIVFPIITVLITLILPFVLIAYGIIMIIVLIDYLKTGEYYFPKGDRIELIPFKVFNYFFK